MSWSRSDRLALASLIVTMVATVAALLVIPDVRSYLGLDRPLATASVVTAPGIVAPNKELQSELASAFEENTRTDREPPLPTIPAETATQAIEPHHVRGPSATAGRNTPVTDAKRAESSGRQTRETSIPPTPPVRDDSATRAGLSLNELRNTTIDLNTDLGTISIMLYPEAAPRHVQNFVELAAAGFYDGTKFHRVIPGFMIQGGDPNTINGPVETWGKGGSERNLQPEFNDIPHERGIVSMARAQAPDSANSQFFICVAPSRFLDRKYTVFGRVTSGMDVVDQIVRARRGQEDRPYEPIAINRARIRR